MQSKCGLVNTLNPCRCSKKAGAFMANGWLGPEKRQFTRDRIAAVREVTPHRLDELAEMERARTEHCRAAAFGEGPDLAAKLRAVVAGSGFAAE
jgi:hypothetical protein